MVLEMLAHLKTVVPYQVRPQKAYKVVKKWANFRVNSRTGETYPYVLLFFRQLGPIYQKNRYRNIGWVGVVPPGPPPPGGSGQVVKMTHGRLSDKETMNA